MFAPKHIGQLHNASVRRHARSGASIVIAEIEPERSRQSEKVIEFDPQPLDVATERRVGDDRRSGSWPPQRVLDEHRYSLLGSLLEMSLGLRRSVFEEEVLIRRPRNVVNGLVNDKAVADVPKHRAAGRRPDQSELGASESLIENLHQKDLLLKRVGFKHKMRKLVEIRVALSRATDLDDELRPT